MKFNYFRLLSILVSIACTPCLSLAGDEPGQDGSMCTEYTVDIYTTDSSYYTSTESRAVEQTLSKKSICNITKMGNGKYREKCALNVSLSDDNMQTVGIKHFQISDDEVAARNSNDKKISEKEAEARNLNMNMSLPAFTLKKCGKVYQTYSLPKNDELIRENVDGMIAKQVQEVYRADLWARAKRLGSRVIQNFNFFGGEAPQAGSATRF